MQCWLISERKHSASLLRQDASLDRKLSACAFLFPPCCSRKRGGKQDPGTDCLSPDGIVSRTEVDEEVPGPVSHLQEIPHALQVGGQEAGSTPNGGHPPGGDSDIVILPGELEHLPMQVIGTLFPGEKRRKGVSRQLQEHPT